MKELLYDWHGLNLWLFHAINHLQGERYDHIMALGSMLADKYLFPLYLIILAVLAGFRWRSLTGSPNEKRLYTARCLEVVLVFAVTFAIGGMLVRWIKETLYYPRPYASLAPDAFRALGAPYSPKLAYLSFPSGHTAFAVLVAMSFWPMLNRTGKLLACFYVLWVCWSRIALGMHYPADVLGSIVLTVPGVMLIRVALHRFIYRTRRGGNP